MGKKQTQQHRVSSIELLTLLFIGLKLTGHITWSWVWVLSPIWIVLVLVIIFCIIKELL